MFYYLIEPLLIYNWILILAAIIPAIFLMIQVYKLDRVEKESAGLLKSLAISGILATMIAMIGEKIGYFLLDAFLPYTDPRYNFFLYFVVVAISEEGGKYFFLKRKTWQNTEFNCQYDGVVYAAFVSLGFALWENINYVLNYGFSTAIVRAITAVPGHACFGVFMGIFYGIAKKYERCGNKSQSSVYRKLAIIIPVLLHGAYDYIASAENLTSGWYFAAFVIVLFFLAFNLVKKMSREDQYI